MADYQITTSQLQDQTGSLQGYAQVSFGKRITITDIEIRKTKEDSLYILMPRYKTGKVDDMNRPVYSDLAFPITAEFRSELYAGIIESFESGKKITVTDKITVEEEQTMKEPKYSISVTPLETEDALKGLATLTIDESFLIKSIAIRESRENEGELSVFLPSIARKKPGGETYYKNICRTSEEFYTVLKEKLIDLYNSKIKEQPEQEKSRQTERPRQRKGR